MNEILERVAQLSTDERNHAFDSARLRIAGNKPLRSEYQVRESKWPTWFLVGVNIAGVMLLLVLFIPSAIRVFHAGYAIAMGMVVNDNTSRHWFGLCAVLSAEIGQVLFSLMAAKTEDATQAKIFNYGAIVCTLIALSGNAYIAGIHALFSPMAFLETFAPPLLTLITAYVFKQQVLDSMKERVETDKLFSEALKVWQEGHDTAHLDSRWQRMVANVLRDNLFRREYKRRPKFAEQITREQWQALIDREWFSENWYIVQVESDLQPTANAAIARPSPKLDITMAWLKDERHAAELQQLSNVAIGAKLGVSHTLVQQAKAKLVEEKQAKQ